LSYVIKTCHPITDDSVFGNLLLVALNTPIWQFNQCAILFIEPFSQLLTNKKKSIIKNDH